MLGIKFTHMKSRGHIHTRAQSIPSAYTHALGNLQGGTKAIPIW
jgi:hypothetical protein